MNKYRMSSVIPVSFFFFNDTATTEIYTLSLHDALPICGRDGEVRGGGSCCRHNRQVGADRKSTRLNSSHLGISYAVFCLKKKTKLYKRRGCAFGDTHTSVVAS